MWMCRYTSYVKYTHIKQRKGVCHPEGAMQAISMKIAALGYAWICNSYSSMLTTLLEYISFEYLIIMLLQE